MSSISADAVREEIRENALVSGNPVKSSNKVNVGAVRQLTSDSSGNLQATASLPIVQPTATSPIFQLTGVGASGTLVDTFVVASDVTTATIGGYIRATLTNTGTGLTTGDYYLPVYTIL